MQPAGSLQFIVSNNRQPLLYYAECSNGKLPIARGSRLNTIRKPLIRVSDPEKSRAGEYERGKNILSLQGYRFLYHQTNPQANFHNRRPDMLIETE